METFTSADGSTRCKACSLHPDQCTCSREHDLMRWLAWCVSSRENVDPFVKLKSNR